jgi:hypothetical protein
MEGINGWLFKDRVDGRDIQSVGWMYEDQAGRQSAIGVRLLLRREMGQTQRTSQLGQFCSPTDHRILLAWTTQMEFAGFRIPKKVRSATTGVLRVFGGRL